jgi:catechol 2,3-dioxygenase-like lactoylglutathione lyase family enzyme
MPPDDPPGSLGPIAAAAVTLYVRDLDASIEWYADTLGLTPVSVSHDEFAYARFVAAELAFVLEPAHAATDPVDSDRTGAAALNLVVERDPAEVRASLVARGVACTALKRSPRFATFLVRDPDGHRIYVTRPRGR